MRWQQLSLSGPSTARSRRRDSLCPPRVDELWSEDKVTKKLLFSVELDLRSAFARRARVFDQTVWGRQRAEWKRQGMGCWRCLAGFVWLPSSAAHTPTSSAFHPGVTHGSVTDTEAGCILSKQATETTQITVMQFSLDFKILSDIDLQAF